MFLVFFLDSANFMFNKTRVASNTFDVQLGPRPGDVSQFSEEALGGTKSAAWFEYHGTQKQTSGWHCFQLELLWAEPVGCESNIET